MALLCDVAMRCGHRRSPPMKPTSCHIDIILSLKTEAFVVLNDEPDPTPASLSQT